MNMISITGSYALSVIKGVAAFTMFPVYEMSHQKLLTSEAKLATFFMQRSRFP